MADFTSRLIPLKKSLSDQVFGVVEVVTDSIRELRKNHRGEEDSLSYRRGSPKVTISNPQLKVLTIEFSVSGENRSLDLWFDYLDHDFDTNPIWGLANLNLHAGDWGMIEKIFDAIEDGVKEKFPDECS